ncbi:hypothetical protein PIB30_089808 [Stylosanthes scabra]|uniref:Uncharacterized protein n=1 Tax=Stylosanthes scabra TaxID=79078 RepID=A0ABU6YTC6_9FABA|nr:hypothetical protein [Stylosanthes scabra]
MDIQVAADIILGERNPSPTQEYGILMISREVGIEFPYQSDIDWDKCIVHESPTKSLYAVMPKVGFPLRKANDPLKSVPSDQKEIIQYSETCMTNFILSLRIERIAKSVIKTCNLLISIQNGMILNSIIILDSNHTSTMECSLNQEPTSLDQSLEVLIKSRKTIN